MPILLIKASHCGLILLCSPQPDTLANMLSPGEPHGSRAFWRLKTLSKPHTQLASPEGSERRFQLKLFFKLPAELGHLL